MMVSRVQMERLYESNKVISLVIRKEGKEEKVVGGEGGRWNGGGGWKRAAISNG